MSDRIPDAIPDALSGEVAGVISGALRRESPLVGFDLVRRVADKTKDAGVLMGECPFVGYVNLRGDAADFAFLSAVQGVLGLHLPEIPNTLAQGDGRLVCWLGPDEWLIMTAPDTEVELVAALRSALDAHLAAVTDVTGGFTMITVAGEQAGDLLAMGCTLDLHPRVFGPGRCTQTLLAKTGVLIRQREQSPALFELVVRRSFADYLWRWLEHGARALGLAVVVPEMPVWRETTGEMATPVGRRIIA